MFEHGTRARGGAEGRGEGGHTEAAIRMQRERARGDPVGLDRRGEGRGIVWWVDRGARPGEAILIRLYMDRDLYVY